MARLVSVMGDSISTFEGMLPDGYRVFYEGELCEETGVRSAGDTWWAQVIDAMGGQLLANASWSGSMVEGAGMPAGNCDERVAALSRGDVAPDDVLVYYGTNDYGWGGTAQQAAARANAVPFCLVESGELPPEAVAGLAPADAAERFGAAYREMLERILARYPHVRIWCITLAPGRVHGKASSTFTRVYRGVPWTAYNQAIAQAAADANAQVARVSGAAEPPCRVLDIAACGYDYDAREGTHPTALGMRQLAWMVCRAMGLEGVAADYPGGEFFRATDPCEEPGRACVGCPHALATGNQWMHVCLR